MEMAGWAIEGERPAFIIGGNRRRGYFRSNRSSTNLRNHRNSTCPFASCLPKSRSHRSWTCPLASSLPNHCSHQTCPLASSLLNNPSRHQNSPRHSPCHSRSRCRTQRFPPQRKSRQWQCKPQQPRPRSSGLATMTTCTMKEPKKMRLRTT